MGVSVEGQWYTLHRLGAARIELGLKEIGSDVQYTMVQGL